MEICIVPDCCEKRCTKLEQENRNLHAFLEEVEKHSAMINNDLAVENCRLKDKASAWEKRCEDLEQENRDLKEHWEYARQTRAEACEARAELEKECVDLKKANQQMDDEIRELRDRLDKKCVKDANEKQDLIGQVALQDARIVRLSDKNRELLDEIKRLKSGLRADNEIVEIQRMELEARKDRIVELEQNDKLREGLIKQYQYDDELKSEEINDLQKQLREAQDRIGDQNWTIGTYDDENRELKKQLEEATTVQVHDAGVFLNGNTQVLGEIVDLKKRNGELLKELDLVRKCAFLSQDIHSLNKWAVWIHEIAVKHGWWETEDGACDDGERPLPEILMLCVTELAEAMEEYRNGKPLAYVEREAVEPTGLDSVPIVLHYPVEDSSKWEPDEKPEGIAIEMLDCVIRILDWMAHQNVDIDLLMRKKVKFNESRSHRHGGKKA